MQRVGLACSSRLRILVAGHLEALVATIGERHEGHANPFVERMDMPVGVMLVVTDAADALRAVGWHDCEELMHTLPRRHFRHATFAMEVHPS